MTDLSQEAIDYICQCYGVWPDAIRQDGDVVRVTGTMSDTNEEHEVYVGDVKDIERETDRESAWYC
jgi:hypothetical protein